MHVRLAFLLALLGPLGAHASFAQEPPDRGAAADPQGSGDPDLEAVAAAWQRTWEALEPHEAFLAGCFPVAQGTSLFVHVTGDGRMTDADAFRPPEASPAAIPRRCLNRIRTVALGGPTGLGATRFGFVLTEVDGHMRIRPNFRLDSRPGKEPRGGALVAALSLASTSTRDRRLGMAVLGRAVREGLDRQGCEVHSLVAPEVEFVGRPSLAEPSGHECVDAVAASLASFPAAEGERFQIAVGVWTSEVITLGSLPEADIDAVVSAAVPAVRRCYTDELSRAPGLAGELVVEFVVGTSGGVERAATERSSLGNSAVEACVNGVVRRLTFPPPDGGGIVIVSYPFVFRAE